MTPGTKLVCLLRRSGGGIPLSSSSPLRSAWKFFVKWIVTQRSCWRWLSHTLKCQNLNNRAKTKKETIGMWALRRVRWCWPGWSAHIVADRRARCEDHILWRLLRTWEIPSQCCNFYQWTFFSQTRKTISDIRSRCVWPLRLVLLPGGDVVRVGVGQARQHHVALLLLSPRLGHCLS